ncbi:hypothetical protein Cri9333_4946 (plasmid) [Crinalium epipsammum PCC 9333]|uniref:Uncharacterized protein n=1 Tax=Crinalium epipsammum PCC 9333 TaxID=1173022 RepID=K9W7I8_9CYAN|nr:hypothetical protein Cri9333_4946 [Crinalium epipsammum PCC 9333]
MGHLLYILAFCARFVEYLSQVLVLKLSAKPTLTTPKSTLINWGLTKSSFSGLILRITAIVFSHALLAIAFVGGAA